MKLQSIADRRRQETSENITISTERFKVLYTIVHAARHSNQELLDKALKDLKAIETRDFMHGVDQSVD